MSVSIPTTEQVELMTSSQLVANFNGLAASAQVKPVKKFETRQIGIKRLTQVVELLKSQVAQAGAERKANGLVAHGEFLRSVDATEASAVQNGTPVAVKTAKEKVQEIAEKAGVKPAKAAKAAPAEPAAPKVTVASRCRELVLEGKTNQEIWAIVQPEFDLPAEKKSYPGWYRAQLKREGKV
jgi:hypothetical protein